MKSLLFTSFAKENVSEPQSFQVIVVVSFVGVQGCPGSLLSDKALSGCTSVLVGFEIENPGVAEGVLEVLG